MKTMNRFCLLLSVAMAFTACNSDDGVLPDAPEKGVVISAGIASDESTRTALGDDTGKTTPVYWSADDKFSLNYGSTVYTFTIKDFAENQTTAKFECAEIPALTEGTYTATYPAGVSAVPVRQTGTKEGLKNYYRMTATLNATDGQGWNDVNLDFETKVAIVKLTLKNQNFKNKTISNVQLLNNGKSVATATSTFKGASDGSITAYFAVNPNKFTNVTVTAKRGSNYNYQVSLNDLALKAGKLYRVNKDITELPISVTGVTIGNIPKEVHIGDEFTLTATIAPNNATDKTVTWRSSNQNIATVDAKGNVKVVGSGTVTITVTSNNGKSAHVEFIVPVEVDGGVTDGDNSEGEGDNIDVKWE